MESQRNPKGKEGKGKEKKGNKQKRNEQKVAEPDGFPEGIFDDPDQPDLAATDTENTLKFMNGKLGKGVVLLSEAQQADLLGKMDIDSFDYYVARLADFILTKQARVKNHYATILKWWEEDGRIVK